MHGNIMQNKVQKIVETLKPLGVLKHRKDGTDLTTLHSSTFVNINEIIFRPQKDSNCYFGRGNKVEIASGCMIKNLTDSPNYQEPVTEF